MTKKVFRIKNQLIEALDDTVSSAKNNAGELHIEIVPLRKIVLDPDNPREFLLNENDLYNGIIAASPEQEKRKQNEKDSLFSLVKSIATQGIINPILVYKHDDTYKLIAGERRFLASILAEKSDIPAKILTSKPDPLKLSLLQWIENMEREDLTLWERLKNLEKILSAYAFGKEKTNQEITGTDLSQLIGCSLQQGANYKSILNGSETLKKYIQSGDIKNIEKAAFIARQSEIVQQSLIEACINGHTLAEMKKMLREKPIEKSNHVGRQLSKVSLGSTTNVYVAKIILESVLKNKAFEKYRDKIGEVALSNPKSLAGAFKKLIKLLEETKLSEEVPV